MMKRTLTICICTFRRLSLVDTLLSIKNQQVSNDIQLDVVVVDSDSAGSAKKIVDSILVDYPFSVNYVVADHPGISAARNKALEESRGDFVAFIDDDEFASPTWISDLVQCADKYRASVVFGHVKSVYPDKSPVWIKNSDLFAKSTKATGTRVNHGPTCNTLIDRSVINIENQKFDLSFGTTGGEDTEFFHRLSRHNVVMVTCQEAIVYETVEEHRLNLKFLLRKAIRVGETYYKIFEIKKNAIHRSIFLFRSTLQFLILLFLSFAVILFSFGSAVKFGIRAAANFGKIRAAFGFKTIELYKNN